MSMCVDFVLRLSLRPQRMLEVEIQIEIVIVEQ